MISWKRSRWPLVLLLLALLTAGGASYQPAGTLAASPPGAAPSTGYTVLGWNNLGMHCYDSDFSNLAILPPYNTLMAQVIKIGDPPQIVTSGVTVDYSFPDNTWSVSRTGQPDKTNFWKYAPDLFHVSLPPNVGLTGKGLAGTLDRATDGPYFIAEGIPLTNVRDQDAASGKTYPFQKALITVKDAKNPKSTLAQLTVVAPVSTELSCANCHADDGDATTGYAPDVQPTGKVETNILTIHDFLNAANYAKYPELAGKTPLMEHQPVLCGSCHSDNAIGTAGVSGIKSLSNAMHGHHQNLEDITPDTDGCYNCHPGPKTQCLRDTMSQNYSASCVDCHGEISLVALNPDPWLNEPQCSTCHGSGFAAEQPQSQPLYQKSQGHGGIYCEACHDSTHAISPSREYNDSIKFYQLQGHTGSLSKCTVCHATKPTGMFHHAKQ